MSVSLFEVRTLAMVFMLLFANVVVLAIILFVVCILGLANVGTSSSSSIVSTSSITAAAATDRFIFFFAGWCRSSSSSSSFAFVLCVGASFRVSLCPPFAMVANISPLTNCPFPTPTIGGAVALPLPFSLVHAIDPPKLFALLMFSIAIIAFAFSMRSRSSRSRRSSLFDFIKC